ncbi:hypothetical protein HRED_10791, partial [Candidatus Haloredivivus sp. G17]
VVMTPERAKAFKKILENNIENYEEELKMMELFTVGEVAAKLQQKLVR